MSDILRKTLGFGSRRNSERDRREVRKIDSKVVTREIRRVIRPILKDAGFTRFTGRMAWRYSEEKIDVIRFASFNSYFAEVCGCTTFSISVEVGCHVLCIPYIYDGIKEKDGYLYPKEHECHIRGDIKRPFHQPELERRDIWYVSPDGDNLEYVLNEIRKAIEREVIPWFDRFENTEKVLDFLQNEDEDFPWIFGFGGPFSPVRSFMTGYVAMALGRWELAAKNLRRALESGRFQWIEDKLEKDIRNVEEKK